MKKSIQLLLLALSVVCIVPSCTITDNNTSVETPIEKEVFEVFYKKFLSDDEFQKERVMFPLKGRYMENEIAGLGTDTTDQVLWTKDNWKAIHKIDESAMKDVKITKSISDSVVVIKTEGVSFNFLFEETYKIKNGLWYLTNLVDIAM